ncbi:MAG: APC family permease [Sporichthyaceae bacterium]
MRVLEVGKRLLLGSPVHSNRLGDTLLSKRIALPIFASGPLSSVAYAPQEIFLVLSVAGIAYFHSGLWFGLAIATMVLVVVASYRQNVRAYPGGGGDYDVAKANLGRTGGLTVGAALIADYVLTVAVSTSAAVDNLGAAVPVVAEHRVAFALLIVAVLALVNLRGTSGSGGLLAIPTYAFVIGMIALIAVGLFRHFALDDDLRAPTADYEIVENSTNLGTLALIVLAVRAFSAGSVAAAGFEQTAHSVPALKEPKPRNAATVLLLTGLASVTMFTGLVALGMLTDVRIAADPARDILIDGVPAGPGYTQEPIIAQVSAAVFGDGSAMFVYLTAVATLILVFAANTSFNGFPLFGEILARDGFLPKQLRQRGDRLAFSNGIFVLAVAAGLLVVAVDADVSQLILMYILAVFICLTLGQVGLVRHWAQVLRNRPDAGERSRAQRARLVNGLGAVLTGAVLLVTVVAEFADGAYVVLLVVPVLFFAMRGIARHYDQVEIELAPPPGGVTLPSRIHGVVLVSRVHTPALRALAFARATRPDTLTALTVQTSQSSTTGILAEWATHDIPVPLTVLDSPYREVNKPILEYVRRLRTGPRDVVCVFVPEYVVGRWWEQLLHNQSALRLKARLLFEPGVMVTSVPWQLGSAELLQARLAHRAGDETDVGP